MYYIILCQHSLIVIHNFKNVKKRYYGNMYVWTRKVFFFINFKPVAEYAMFLRVQLCSGF